MFKVAALNCDDFADICEKNDVRAYPSFKVYPPVPTPIFDYEGDIETTKLMNYMGKFIANKIKELNLNIFDSFITERPNIPKVILFTDKKGFPLIFKSLAVSFDVV
jgi:hypothetical protein